MKSCCTAHMCTRTTSRADGLCRVHGRKRAPSFRAEMLVGEQWCSNALRFESPSAAALHGKDLFMRWTQPKEWRVVSCDDEPTWGTTEVACHVALACEAWGVALAKMAKRRKRAPRFHDNPDNFSSCLAYEAYHTGAHCPCGGTNKRPRAPRYVHDYNPGV